MWSAPVGWGIPILRLNSLGIEVGPLSTRGARAHWAVPLQQLDSTRPQTGPHAEARAAGSCVTLRQAQARLGWCRTRRHTVVHTRPRSVRAAAMQR